MQKTKQSLVALVVLLTFLVTSVFPLPKVLASEASVSFSAETVGSDTLEITATGTDAEDFMASVHEVRVVGSVYQLPQTNSRLVFETEGNKITIEESPAIFKENLIELVSSSFGTKSFIYQNPEGSSIAEGLEITSVISGEEGKSEIVNGQELGAFAKYVGFTLDYDYNNSNGSALFSLSRQITKVNFDGAEYPRLDERGDANFILWNGALNAYDQYPVGKKILADYEKNGGEKGKHRVEIFFTDNSSVVYEDKGYVPPKKDSEETPLPSTGEEDNTTLPEVEPSTGLGDKYELKAVTISDTELRIQIDPKEGAEIKKLKGKDSEIYYDFIDLENIDINGQVFTKSFFKVDPNENYVTSTKAEVIVAAKAKNPITLKVKLDADSYFNAAIKASKANEAGGGNTTEPVTPPNTNPVDPTPSEPAEPAEGSLAKKYPVNAVTFEKAYKEIRIDFPDAFSRSVAEKIEKVVINGVEFDKDLFQFSYIHDYLSGDRAVYEQAIKNEVIDLRIHFNDKSVARFNKAVALPPADIALKYEIGDVSLTDTEFRVDVNLKNGDQGLSLMRLLSASENDLSSIEKVKINELNFWNTDFKVEGNTLISTEKRVIDAAKAENPIAIEVFFNDKSSISATKEVTQGGTNEPQASQNANIEAKEANVSETRLTMSFEDGKALTQASLVNLKEVSVNGEVFPYTGVKFSLDGETFISTDSAVVAKAKEKSPVKVILTFKDDSQVFFNKDAVQTDNPVTTKPTEEVRQIASVSVTKPTYGKPELVIAFDKPVELAKSSEFRNSVETVSVNGQDFPASFFFINYMGEFKTSEEVIVEKANERAPITLKITFKDGSVISKDLDTAPENPTVNGLTLASDLQDGDYTLTYRAYKKGTKEGSVLEEFFDKKAKLHVEGGVKTVTFLNHVYAELTVDFAVTDNGETKPLVKKVIRTNKNGEAVSAEFSTSLSTLTGKFDAYVLGTGPMGGRPSDKGNYSSDSYKQLDLVFDNEVTEGFTDFIKNEEYNKKREKNNETLINALIEQGFDTNDDDQISPEELRAGKGMPARLIESTKVPNVLNLEGLGLIDISLLKDLGPGVEHLNLDGNDIESLPAGLFDHATGLKRIFLGGNDITSIPAGLFNNTTKLTYLDLEGNPISTLPAGIFSTTDKLEILSLTNTKLTSLPNDLLHNAPKLKELYLRENPNLTSLSDDFFKGQKSTYLNRVELGYTGITSIPSSLGDKKALRQLGAEHANISMLPDLSGLTGVERVDFEGNAIKEFPLGLYKTMVKRAKTHNYSNHVKLDLSMNDIKVLPLDEMQQNADGAKRLTLQVDRNYLKSPLTSAEEKAHQDLGISFKKGSEDTYYPQKGASNFVGTATGGMINLNSDFDILEMYYWQMGDVAGQSKFKNASDFLTYLQGEGRVINNVSKTLPREEAIKQIFEAKHLAWKVETTIVKNGNTEVFRSLEEGKKEGLSQSFKDVSMRAGDNYTLTKKLYRKSISGWAFEMSLHSDFVAESSSTEVQKTKVPVALYEKNTNNLSMANATLKREADLEERGGKFYYTVYLKPMEVRTLTGEVVKFYYTKDGVKTLVPAENVGGEYPKAYTMEFNSAQKRVPVSFETNLSFLGERGADLVFGDAPEVLPTEKTVKAYVVTTSEDKMSMADNVIVRDVTYTEDETNYHFSVGFKPMTLQGESAKVDKLWLKRGETLIPTTKDTQKEGFFTFSLPKVMVDKARDTKLPIAFTLLPAVTGHDRPLEAKLLLDWNNDFEPIKDGTTSTPSVEEGRFNAYILTKDKTKLSMADTILERKASFTDKDGWRTVKLRFSPMELQGERAKVKRVLYEAMGDVRVMTKEAEEGVFSFKMPVFATSMTGGKELKVFFELEPKVTGHDKALEALLVLDWDNSFTPPKTGDSSGNTGGSSGGSEPAESVSNVSAWAKNPANGERSMADRSLKPSVKVTESNGRFTYEVGFKPVTIPFGGKDITGNIIELSALVDGREEVLRESGRYGDYTLYTITLDRKLSELPIRFDVDYMKDLGGGKRDAIIVLDWNGNSSAPSGGGPAIIQGGGAAPIILAPSKNPFELKESVKLTSFKGAYMKGYPDGSFKPNNKITRAESAIVYSNFVDLSQVKNNQKLIYVKKNAWYESVMEKLFTLGLWDKQQKSTKLVIKPDEAITRAELAQALAAIKGLKVAESKKTFSDLDKNHWAHEAIIACAEAGILTGYGDGTIKPDGQITRAEFVSMVNRAFDLSSVNALKGYTDVSTTHWAYQAISVASH